MGYYLTSIDISRGRATFHADAIWDARLEVVASFSGQLQRDFCREMDRLFSFLQNWEGDDPDTFQRLRELYRQHQEILRIRTLRRIVEMHEEFIGLIELGIAAVRCRREDESAPTT
jgi:hypothetical protein